MTLTHRPEVAHVPRRRPRRLKTSVWSMLRAQQSFWLLFGGIWAAVGGILSVVFFVIGLGFAPFLLAALLSQVFFVVGAALVLWALREVLKDRRTLMYGRRIEGEVVEVAEDRSLLVNRKYATRITYKPSDPTEPSGHVKLFEQDLIDAHPPGTRLVLLVDSLDPSRVCSPALLGATFERPVPGRDERPLSPSTTIQASAHPGPREHRLLELLEPIGGGWLSRGKLIPAGRLGLEADQLQLFPEAPGARPQRVPLPRPFQVRLTAWLVSDQEAELCVQVRPLHAPAQQAPMKFKTRLPQSALSNAIPLKEEEAPMLPPEDFAGVWARLMDAAALHGGAELVQGQVGIAVEGGGFIGASSMVGDVGSPPGASVEATRKEKIEEEMIKEDVPVAATVEERR